MKRQLKFFSFLIVLAVISYNIFDYFNAKKKARANDIAKCVGDFMTTNPDVSKVAAQKYCECSADILIKKYKGKKPTAEEILANESEVMQDCFDKAIADTK